MRVTIAAAVACLVGGISMADDARAAVRKSTNIPAQNLGAALQTLARERDIQVVYFSNSIDTLGTQGAVGELTVDEALGKLLSGSGLVYRYLDDNTVTIVPVAGSSPPATASSNVVTLEEVIVTGTNIRGVSEIAAPSFTFTREQIEKAGFTSIEQLFRSVPQNLNELSNEGSIATGVSRVANENSQNAAGISLRGLGPTATLVLLNGQRRPGNVYGQVFDISAIPLSIIERVEVVTGGRSAVYGSDAVAGVVNIVTRRDFEGAETSASYGTRDESGGERFQASQILGFKGERGSLTGAYDYSETQSLDATAADAVGKPHPLGVVPVPGRFLLAPDGTRHSLFLSGQLGLSDRIKLVTDGLYTRSENHSEFAFVPASTPLDPVSVSFQTGDVRSEQYSASAGASIELGRWNLDITGTRGVLDNVERSASNTGPSGTTVEARTSSISAVAEGPLVSIGSVEVRAALGAEHRQEDLSAVLIRTGAPFRSEDRSVDAVFGELFVPLVADGRTPGLHRLELSLAGRYDDYSDVGSVFNPQAGLIWSPFEELRVRASYSEAFRAPDLAPSGAGSSAFLAALPDPASPPSTPALILMGRVPDLRPEEATTWSFGVDYEPTFAPWARLSASYFDIAYDGRIDDPAGANFFFALSDEQAYGSLIDRAPTQARIDEVFAPILAGAGGFVDFTFSGFNPFLSTNLFAFHPDMLVFDNRRGNISFETVRGLDLNLAAQLDRRAGQFSFGVNGTYYLEYERQITQQGLAIDQFNRPGKPVDLRVRGSAGWTRAALGVFAYLNYVDGYHDPRATPPADIKSWTTTDLTLRFDGSRVANAGWLNGCTAALSVQNVFDEAPPLFTGNAYSLNYDGANASRIGRYISLQLAKRW